MSKTIQDRIAKLENAAPNKKSCRPLPLCYFYGEPLPADFHTNDKYIKREVPTMADFYAQETKP